MIKAIFIFVLLSSSAYSQDTSEVRVESFNCIELSFYRLGMVTTLVLSTDSIYLKKSSWDRSMSEYKLIRTRTISNKSDDLRALINDLSSVNSGIVFSSPHLTKGNLRYTLTFENSEGRELTYYGSKKECYDDLNIEVCRQCYKEKLRLIRKIIRMTK